MPKPSFGVRLRARLAADPALANRVLALLGAKRLEHIGQRAAMRAARNAYRSVPYYRRLYEAHGFDAARMARLDWATFLTLPTANKATGLDLPDEDLLDGELSMPIDDALIGRSSGTTRKPVAWPMSWDDYALLRATFRANLLELRADREKTAVMLLLGAEGVEYAGNTMYRVMFSIKEETHWPMEVFLTGDNVTEIAALLKWIVQRGYTSMFMISFPGTYERMLDLLAHDPEAVGMWEGITRKKVISGGQLVSKRLRDRLTADLGLPTQDLLAIEILYISSDSGQTIGRTTAFSAYVQRCLDARPELYERLGLDADHRRRNPCLSSSHRSRSWSSPIPIGGTAARC